MPVYEYECEKCGHRFDVEHGINEQTKKKCPECRGKIRKCFSAVGIVFKGSGFYVNDNKGKKAGVKPACASCESKPDSAPACESAAACGSDTCAAQSK